MAKWVECSALVEESCIQSQVPSYLKLLKCYLITPWLTLGNIRYVSRLKWSSPGKGVAPSSTPRYSSYWKGSLRVTLEYSCPLYLLILLVWSSKIISSWSSHVSLTFITFLFTSHQAYDTTWIYFIYRWPSCLPQHYFDVKC